MTWVKLDDGFATHPKIEELSDRSLRVHLRGLCFCAKHLTDGHIPTKTAKAMGPAKCLTELVDSTLWEVNGSGYVVHDYTEYNPTRAEVEDVREKRHKRAVAGAKARWDKDAQSDAASDATSILDSNDRAHAPVLHPSLDRNQEDKDGEEPTPLSVSIHQLLQKLDEPPGGQTHLELIAMSTQLPQADFEFVREELRARRPRNKKAYALKILNNRLREAQTA